jgi:hypothetical protein
MGGQAYFHVRRYALASMQEKLANLNLLLKQKMWVCKGFDLSAFISINNFQSTITERISLSHSCYNGQVGHTCSPFRRCSFSHGIQPSLASSGRLPTPNASRTTPLTPLPAKSPYMLRGSDPGMMGMRMTSGSNYRKQGSRLC